MSLTSPHRALDGGRRRTELLGRAANAAARWLRPGGSDLLELGGDQATEMRMRLSDAGFVDVRVHRDIEAGPLSKRDIPTHSVVAGISFGMRAVVAINRRTV